MMGFLCESGIDETKVRGDDATRDHRGARAGEKLGRRVPVYHMKACSMQHMKGEVTPLKVQNPQSIQKKIKYFLYLFTPQELVVSG